MNDINISTIIKSPEAERMRQMVTRGFYDQSRTALWIFEVIGREYDDMADWARKFRLEAFPQTCTWSIAIWEFVYGFEPDDNLTLEYRRQRILSRILNHPPLNPARIEAVLSALTGCPVAITENVAPYTFRVMVDESDNSIYNYNEALKRLRKIKPSHLSFEFISEISVEFTKTDYDCFGSQFEYITEYYLEETEIITLTSDWSVGVLGDHMQEYFSEFTEIPTATNIWDAEAVNEFVKEDFIE